MTSPSALINLELLRVLRLRRVFRDTASFLKFERALGIRTTGVKEWQLQLARVLLSLFTLLSVSTGLIYTAEHGVNPCITNYFTALYFGLVTLSTVGMFSYCASLRLRAHNTLTHTHIFGLLLLPTLCFMSKGFGDIVPLTWQGKLVVCGSILAGVAVVPAQAGALVEALLARQDDSKKRVSKHNDQRSSKNGDDGRMILETSFECPSCGSTMHWSLANFCWSCGDKLT
jgi:hypothetical protein